MRPKILCLDDENKFLEDLEIFLLPNGFDLIKALNSEEALEELKKEKIDLAILDAHMPKLDGFELCRIIKTDENYMNIPVILTADLPLTEERIKGIEAGAEDIFLKPFNPVEILERIKTLFSVKQPKEKRLGELLIDMNFINEEELKEGLRIAKERRIKLGEALISLGAIDKDHIYWALSNQLKMSYIELSSEMIDRKLIREFSIATLEQLQCLPLYETDWETHFAIADPADQNALRAIKGLNPLKGSRLHLALPEKIDKILEAMKGELAPSSDVSGQPKGKIAGFSSMEPEFQGSLEDQKKWDILVGVLLSLNQNESCWLYRDSVGSRLILQKEGNFKPILLYPQKIFDFFKQRIEQETVNRNTRGIGYLFMARGPGPARLFKARFLNFLHGTLIRIEPVPIFSAEDFLSEHPLSHDLLGRLQNLFHENSCLLIGGKKKLLVKKFCYSLCKMEGYPSRFPPPLFFEHEIEIHFPEAAQLSDDQFNLPTYLDCFRDAPTLFVFYEFSTPEFPKEAAKVISGPHKNLILYMPFPSSEAMKENLSSSLEWQQVKNKAIFLENNIQEIM
jgi:DNA-binding response OmpR family regulator